MNLTNSSMVSQDAQSGPVSASSRIPSLDIIRGISLLGILMINIEFFSTPEEYLVNPILWEDFEGLNKTVWLVKQYLFTGKMWSLFSMLFGAGAYLLISRAEIRGKASVIADIYYRRLIFLLLFGLIHAYLIWSGDVLFIYAIVGLFLHPLRRLSFRWMIVLILALFIINLSLYMITYRNDILLHQEVIRIEAIVSDGKALIEEQEDKLNQWKEKASNMTLDTTSIQKKIEIMSNGSYLAVRQEENKWVHYMHTELMYNRAFLD